LLIAALLAQRARRRSAEERVRALNRRLITAQEDERKSIARELHDDLSQRLARLSIDAAQLERGPVPAARAGATAEMRGELTRLSDDVHRLAYQLHPSTLDDLGLTEALRIECDRVSRLESVPVRMRAPEPAPELPRDAALGLFRIAQEALRNAVRHARATGVDLALEPEGSGVRLSIRDDGAGFDPAADRGRASLGLASMRERAELFGGRLDIRSSPGRGTTIEVWAPAGGTTA
jgi:signal transduction histidine kinase